MVAVTENRFLPVQVGLLLFVGTCVMTVGLASAVILPMHLYRYKAGSFFCVSVFVFVLRTIGSGTKLVDDHERSICCQST